MHHCLHALGHPKLPPIRKLKGSGSKTKKREKMPAGLLLPRSVMALRTLLYTSYSLRYNYAKLLVACAQDVLVNT